MSSSIVSAIAPVVWKLVKPLLRKGAKKLRDKWARELKEADDAKVCKKPRGAAGDTLVGDIVHDD
jgi:hypothetical protein